MMQRVSYSALFRLNPSIRNCNPNLTKYYQYFNGNYSLVNNSIRSRSSHHPTPTPKPIQMTTNIEPAEDEDTKDSHKRKLLDVPEIRQISLLNDEDNQEALDSLIESYNSARQESSSTWLNFETCYIYLYRGGGQPNSVLAAFDLDGTLIKPKGRSKIPKSATDWDLFSVWTKVKLQKVIRDNEARFVIFTNQNGIGLKLVAREEIQERIELVTQSLGIPCTVLVATEKDKFRKPKTGMFKLFLRSFNDSNQVDCERSFYCGDAVGYPSHSDADIKFAESLCLPFLSPEKFVRGVKPKLVQAV